MFEQGKRYLVERKSKAHGGGIFEIKIEEVSKKHVRYDGKWRRLGYLEEEFKILETLEDEDSCKSCKCEGKCKK